MASYSSARPRSRTYRTRCSSAGGAKMPAEREPVMEGARGGVLTRDDIWELFTASLLERRDGADELLGIMVELGMKGIPEQKAFVAMATEFQYLARVSSG